jgi:hypothetical protein
MVDGYLANGRTGTSRSGRSPGVIRVRHLTLPAGLIAVVRKDGDGGLQVFVSDTLAADRQRAAVRLALRSIYRPGRRAGLLPVPLGLLLGAFWRSITMPITRAVRSHAVAGSAAAVVMAAGATALIIGLPQHHGPAMAGKGPGHGLVHAPAAGRTHIAAKPRPGHGKRPAPGATTVAGRSASPSPGRITATPAPQSATPSASGPAQAKPSKSAAPQPSGRPSPTQTAASSPSPSPPTSGHGTCLVILGVWVCL